MSLLSSLICLRDKHLHLCKLTKKVGEYLVHPSHKHNNLAVLEHMYSLAVQDRERGSEVSIKMYEDMYEDDVLFAQGLDKLSQLVRADIKRLAERNDPTRKYAFITVGWNEQVVTARKMLAASQNILKLKYFKTAYMVLEKHRENGVHHHTHYLVEFDDKYPVSKVLGWVYQTRGVKELCLNKNFIDYLGPQNGKKSFQTYEKYFEYISGNKKVDKMSYVALDDEWRSQNGIEKRYEKL